jgi:hypothetical protein
MYEYLRLERERLRSAGSPVSVELHSATKYDFTGYYLSICLFSLHLSALSVTEGYATTNFQAVVSNGLGSMWKVAVLA